MNKSLFLLVLSWLFAWPIFGQAITDTSYYDEKLGNVRIRKNTKKGHEEIMFYGGFIKKDSLGKVIFDGNKSGHCGCEPINNGFWIYYYSSGKIKEQGSYDCGDKVGTWIQFYENGSIKQLSNFKRPYTKSFIAQFSDSLNIRNTNSIKHGQHLEYFNDGKIKTSGQFEIILIKSNIDSIAKIDPVTHRRYYTQIKGVFWRPKSIKLGTWKHYTPDGDIKKIENYTLDDIESRDLDYKYWEAFLMLIEE